MTACDGHLSHSEEALSMLLCLQVGDLVYARVTAADRDLDPVLACVDAQGKVSYQHFTSHSCTDCICKRFSALLESCTSSARTIYSACSARGSGLQS